MGEVYGKIGLCPAFCRNCIYRSRQHNTCDYIVIEGHSRARGQALPGEGCTVRVTGTRRAPPHVVHGQRSSPRTLPETKPRKRPGQYAPTQAHLAKLELWEDGRTDSEIAEIMGIERKTVVGWRRAHNLPPNMPPKPEPKPAPKPKPEPKPEPPKPEPKPPKQSRRTGLQDFPERMALYQQGMNDAQIAEAVGATRNAIANWRAKRNLPRVQNGRLRMDAGSEEKRMELYRQGLNDCQISRELGVTDTSIRLWRKARGLPSNRPVKRLSPEQAALRMQMYEAGASDREIGEALGLNPNNINVWRQLKKLKCNSKK